MSLNIRLIAGSLTNVSYEASREPCPIQILLSPPENELGLFVEISFCYLSLRPFVMTVSVKYNIRNLLKSDPFVNFKRIHFIINILFKYLFV